MYKCGYQLNLQTSTSATYLKPLMPNITHTNAAASQHHNVYNICLDDDCYMYKHIKTSAEYNLNTGGQVTYITDDKYPPKKFHYVNYVISPH